MSVSVIICSHNGEARISPTLEALARCEASFPVEIILVDNNSSDGMVESAQAVWERVDGPFELRIISERRLGKCFAQRAGTLGAKHEIVIFCDDDNWLFTDYLTIASEILSDPKVGAVGGQAEPVFEVPPPALIYSHGRWSALGIQALWSGDVTDSFALWGAGLAVRRTDLLTIYRCPGLPVLTGPSGALSSARGDDTELCWALTVLGKRIMYDDRLKLRHFMPRERLHIDYFRKRQAEGVDWDAGIRRFLAGLDLIHRSGRVRPAVKSAFRCLRHWNWPEERRFQASLFLAACGWKSRMREVDRNLYTAFHWLQSAGRSELREREKNGIEFVGKELANSPAS